jgi:hypothetical protein
MVDTPAADRMDVVRAEIRDPLRELITHLRAGLGDNLKSVTVVGSCLTEDFHPHSSDINTVVVVDRYDLVVLDAVAALTRPMARRRLAPPVLMTPAYIDRSRDVFGVEFLDFQLTHETVFGDDPFAALPIDKTAVRLQCERELKAMLMRLRQGYIAAAGQKKAVHELLLGTAKGLVPLARALLWLKDLWRPKTMQEALRAVAQEFRLDLNDVIAVGQNRHEKRRPTDAEVEAAFVNVVAAVELLTAIVDQLEL